jgi:methyl-accepting chemotaxis protein
MPGWWPARRGTGTRHPLLSSVDQVLAVLDAAPAVLLVTDGTGEIIYRNQAAQEMQRQTLATQGQQALVALRDSLKQDARTAQPFPLVKTRSVDAGNGELVHGTSTMNRFPGGFVVTWANTTEQVRTAEIVRELTEELSSASTQLTAAGEALVSTAGQAAGQADVVSRGSAEMTESIREIAQRVSNAASNTDTAVGSARDAARSMEQLQESSRQISTISQLITSIADQTKLLALNATIESARVGELGKGFAVVAGEVKELAARTAEATSRITEMVQGIQTESTQVADGITAIVGMIDTVAEQQTMIAGAVEEQTATSAEMSSGMGSVAQSVQESAAAADTVLRAAGSLREQASRLRELTITNTVG